MARGIDYSFSRPSPASIVAAGYSTVGRYLASSTSKRLSAAEAASLQGAGLSIFLVFEDFADPLSNWTATSDHQMGVLDAGIAIGQANALGVPVDRPIYVAVDVAQPVSSKNSRYVNYFQGWVDTLGIGRLGMYGGGLLWDYLRGQGVMGTWFWQAAAASWSNYIVPYPGAQVLQAVGSVLSGTSDEDTTFTADWGQWPAPTVVGPSPPPPPTAPGGTNTANTGLSSASYAQTNKHSLITPQYATDQVLYSTTVTATLATGFHSGLTAIVTGIGQTAYPIGIFTADGGATYNDFGFHYSFSFPADTIKPSVTVQANVDAAGVVSFDGQNDTGASVSVTINLALLASYAPSRISSSRTTLGTNLSYSSFYPKLTADATTKPYSTYRRIASDSHTGTGAVSVSHGQSAVPNILFWPQVSGQTVSYPVAWSSAGAFGGNLGIKLDATTIAFSVDAGNFGDCYYRIYKDN